MPLRFAIWAGVHMQRDKQIGVFGVGHGRAIFQRDEAVVIAGQNHLYAHFFFKLRGKLPRDSENQIFFRNAADADGSGILAAMARIEDNFA